MIPRKTNPVKVIIIIEYKTSLTNVPGRTTSHAQLLDGFIKKTYTQSFLKSPEQIWLFIFLNYVDLTA